MSKQLLSMPDSKIGHRAETYRREEPDPALLYRDPIRLAAETLETEASDAVIEKLIMQLVGHLDAIPLPYDATDSDEAEHKILDIEIEGVRYLLFRRPQTEPFRSPSHLSPREYEIARMVAKGFPNKTIAAVLDISFWTVNTHLKRIFAKLGVSSRAAMVATLLDERG